MANYTHSSLKKCQKTTSKSIKQTSQQDSTNSLQECRSRIKKFDQIRKCVCIPPNSKRPTERIIFDPALYKGGIWIADKPYRRILREIQK